MTFFEQNANVSQNFCVPASWVVFIVVSPLRLKRKKNTGSNKHDDNRDELFTHNKICNFVHVVKIT
jgi:hypothetical protein